jgi:hypothetical protein
MEAQFFSTASIFPRMWRYIWMGQLQWQVCCQAWFYWGHKKSVAFSECVVSRQALVSNELKNDGTWNSQWISQSINFIKNPPLNISPLCQICSEMNCEDAAITFYSKIRLLSHGVVLKVLFELRNEVYLFSF